MIDAAAHAGADAVKFQTIDPEASYVPGTPSYEEFSGKTFSLEQYQALVKHSSERGVIFFTTPGDFPSLELCRRLSLPTIKVSSGLMTNIPLILAAARMKVPLLISTGGAYLWEIGRVVYELERIGMTDIALLHCVSLYPAPDEALGLRAIEALKSAFPYPVGYSDHSLGRVACICALSLGACVIEKHLTLSQDLRGADHHLASEPDEFAALVQEIRACEKMLMREGKQPLEDEMEFRKRYRRRLVANVDVSKGQVLSAELVGLKRPLQPSGLPAEFYADVLGKKATRAIRQHEPIDWDAITKS